MSRLPRVAVGTIQPGADTQLILWGLLEACRLHGIQVQDFLSQACFSKSLSAERITGLSIRHLDSWLMSPEVCRDLFSRAAQAADLSIIEGVFSGENGEPFDDTRVSADLGGRLDTLCGWMNVPKIVVLDVAQMGMCRRPPLPAGVEGVFLNGVADADQVARLAVDFESLWGVPVLGAMEAMPQLRAELESLPVGAPVPHLWFEELGVRFARYWKPYRMLEIAQQREFPKSRCRRCRCSLPASDLTVAIAYDEAFCRYFPDIFDLLESRGASVVDFSPLRDENLPPRTDIVYFGCGHPERFASALAENHCMKAALRSHVRAGTRIYGEGAGAAYLCQQMETPDGQFKQMAGVLPAVARLRREPTGLVPVEVRLSKSNWLGREGARLRGYRNASWYLEPVGTLRSLADRTEHPFDLAGNYQAVGSMLHLHFAAQPEFLDQFFESYSAASLHPWTTPLA